MAINWANIAKTQLFEDTGWRHHTLHILFSATHKILGMGHAAQRFFAPFTELVVKLARPKFRKISREATNIMADRHLIIVKHHQQVFIHMTCMVNGFKGHTCSHSTITHYRDSSTFFAELRRRHRHAKSGANRGTGMAYAKRIVITLGAFGKARQAVLLAHA